MNTQTQRAQEIANHIRANHQAPEGWRLLVACLGVEDSAENYGYHLALYQAGEENPSPDNAVLVESLEPLDEFTASLTATRFVQHAKACDSLAKMLGDCAYLVLDPARKGKVTPNHSSDAIQILWQPEKQLFDPIPYLAEWGDRPTTPFNAGVSLSLDRITRGMTGTLVLDLGLDHLVQLPTLSSRPIRREDQTPETFGASVCSAATQIVLELRAHLSAVHAQTRALWHIVNQSTTLIEVLEFARSKPENEPPPGETSA